MDKELEKYKDWNDPFDDYPHGVCFKAVYLRMVPADWARLNIRGFRKGYDDLDFVMYLYLEHEGKILVLEHYPRSPQPLGTNIVINPKMTNRKAFIKRFLARHRIDNKVIWTSPDL